MYPLIQQIFRVPTSKIEVLPAFYEVCALLGVGAQKTNRWTPLYECWESFKGNQENSWRGIPTRLDGQGSFLETVMFKLSLMNSMLWEEMGSVYFV